MPSTVTYSAMANNTQSRSQRKSKMSVTQTYFLAHSARGKLSREAARPDHDLRLLVGHANMLDSLMLDIANAEQEQEKWFNRSVLGADADDEEEEKEEVVQAFPDTIMEEPESDWEVDDTQTSDDESDDDEELTLTRTTSRHSPPELTTSDSDSDSDDDAPPSPETSIIDSITQLQRQALVTSSYYEVKETAVSETEEDDSFYLPSRSEPTIIAAY